jgi:hypothetical protein
MGSFGYRWPIEMLLKGGKHVTSITRKECHVEPKKLWSPNLVESGTLLFDSDISCDIQHINV